MPPKTFIIILDASTGSVYVTNDTEASSRETFEAFCAEQGIGTKDCEWMQFGGEIKIV